jgi:trigger factor
MKSEIETLGPCKVKIKVEIPTEEIRNKIEEKFREVRQNVVLPGFRKGHVPRPILEKRFGKSVEEDAKNDLIEKSISQTIEDRKIQAVGDPDFDPEKVEFSPEKPLNFELTVETKPEVKPKDYLGLAVTKKKSAVSDADVEEGLKRLARARAEWMPADTVSADDLIIADLSLTADGESILSEKDMQVVVSKDIEILHEPAPQAFEALIGAASGDTRTAEITIPQSFGEEKFRGKTSTFSATVKEIKRLNVPAIDDAWAKSLDYDSLDRVKEELRRRLQSEKDAAGLRDVEQQIVDQLLTKHEIPLPEALLRKFSARSEERMKLEMMVRGVPEEKADEAVSMNREKSKEELEKMLRAHFLLEAIGQKERIFVTEDEVDSRLDVMAAATGRMPGEVRGELEARGQMSELRQALREEKIRRFLREKAKVADSD